MALRIENSPIPLSRNQPKKLLNGSNESSFSCFLVWMPTLALSSFSSDSTLTIEYLWQRRPDSKSSWTNNSVAVDTRQIRLLPVCKGKTSSPTLSFLQIVQIQDASTGSFPGQKKIMVHTPDLHINFLDNSSLRFSSIKVEKVSCIEHLWN